MMQLFDIIYNIVNYIDYIPEQVDCSYIPSPVLLLFINVRTGKRVSKERERAQ